LAELETSSLGQRYPAIARTWRTAWPQFVRFLAFPPELRRVVYSTNLIESINARLRKVTRRAVRHVAEPRRGGEVDD
jgi:transposase-like protein